MRQHLAELLLDLKLHSQKDRLRARHPFAPEIAATNAILFSRKYNKRRKLRTYREWLESYQPCVFGKIAAKNKLVFICLLEEHEILQMSRGDADLSDTIQDYRQAWKRYALEGLSSSFVLVLVSPALTVAAPGPELKETCRRLMELYMEVDRIDDDTILPQREYVFLRRAPTADPEILKFATLPNVFCAQADGRWWHDHRTPGGIMITSNALGHFTYSRLNGQNLETKDLTLALENAMRTISNAFPGSGKRLPRGLRHCPATNLVNRDPSELTPLKDTSPMCPFSPDHYEGFFHTDHLVPSVFFQPDRDPAELTKYPDLSFRYINDGASDPRDHAELMTGLGATLYEVRRSMDRLPQTFSPERSTKLTDIQKAKLGSWLESRLKARVEA